jgi:hypothetical protein
MTRCRRGLLLVTVLLGGCGGSAEAPKAPLQPRPSAADVAVIRNWGLDMQHGEVKRASALFGLPAVVANNTPEIQMTTRAEVEFFHATLPCGGRLVRAESHHGAILATFELTDRPGGGCGSGTGHLAQAAFSLRGGKIVRWIRVPNLPGATDDGEGLV